jgi:hypothetical protein
MKTFIQRTALASITLTTALGLAATTAVYAETPKTGSTSTTASNAAATKDAQRLANIQTHGDAEISRRLTLLGTLNAKINATTKLTSSDKASLSAEVASEINGLTALKAKLDVETTVSAAVADAQSIVSDYRVFALIVPKISLIQAADDQQVVESKLIAFAAKLQTRLDSAKAKGKDTSSAQAQLDDLRAKVTASQAISLSVEAKVIVLQPTDYNSDHAILSGYRDQLKTAHSDNEAAFIDAKGVITALKSL